MNRLLHKLLYRILPLGGYLQTVSAMFFLSHRLGIGRHAPATEYTFHLDRLMRAGDLAIDIGANLGYYARLMSRIAGRNGHVYAVEPVAPIRRVLERNLSGCGNVDILPLCARRRRGRDPHGQRHRPHGRLLRHGTEFRDGGGRRGRRGVHRRDAARQRAVRPPHAHRLHQMRRRRLRSRHHGGDAAAAGTIPPHGAHRDGRREPRPHRRAFTELGYDAYTLHRGQEIPLRAGSKKRHHLPTEEKR